MHTRERSLLAFQPHKNKKKTEETKEKILNKEKKGNEV